MTFNLSFFFASCTETVPASVPIRGRLLQPPPGMHHARGTVRSLVFVKRRDFSALVKYPSVHCFEKGVSVHRSICQMTK